MLERHRPDAANETARKRFLDAAAELFAAKGYHATSMRDIARAVSVTPGAVYAHFPSKRQLLLAVYAAGVGQIERALEAEKVVGPPWEALECACRRHLEALLAPSGYARVVIRVLPADVPEVAGALRDLRNRYEARFRRLIAGLDLDPGIDPALLRLTLLGALNWVQVWYREGGAKPADIARHIVLSLRHGAGRRQGSPTP